MSLTIDAFPLTEGPVPKMNFVVQHEDGAELAFNEEREVPYRLPADWHLSRFSPNGAVEVSNQAVERRYRGSEGWQGRVNLAGLAGKRIGLKRSAIEQIIGQDARHSVSALIRLKLIEEHPETRKGIGKFYWYDPGWSLQDIYDLWVEHSLNKPARHHDFVKYREVRRACRIPADDPVAECVIEAAVEMLADLGTTELTEINAFLPLGRNEIERCQAVRRRLDAFWRRRASTSLPLIDRATVLDEFPGLADARNTNLMTGLSHERPAPPPEALARAWRLGPLRKSLILLLYVAAAKGERRDFVMNLVHSFELIDETFRALRPDGMATDAEDIDFVLGTFVFGHLESKVRMNVREHAARSFMVGVAWLRRWIKHTGGTAFDAFNCAQVSERGVFLSQMREVYSHISAAGRAERLRRSAEAASRYVSLQEIAYMRKESVCDTAATARRAIKEMGDAPCIKFSVYDRVMGPDGSLFSGAQRNDWIIWRRPPTGCGLPEIPERPPLFTPLAVEQGAEENDNAGDLLDLFEVDLDGYIFEFVGCAPVIGGDCYDPWYITCAEHGTWVSPALLDPEMQEARHNLIKAWCLPAYPSTPAGLLRFGTSDSSLFRRTARERRTIFPLGQFELAMRFAHLSLRAAVESFCRSGEFRQMVHRVSRWPTKEKDGVTRYYFSAFKKVANSDGRPDELDEFQVAEQTHDEAFETAEAVIARCYADLGYIPDIDPPSALDWKCEPGPLILSWRGRHLQLASLLVFFRYLLANTGEQFGFHDLRHASAKDARMIGLPMIMIQDSLKHAFPEISAYYASLTPELIASRTEDDLSRRRAEIAKRATYRIAA